jgi:hypothetical protein
MLFLDTLRKQRIIPDRLKRWQGRKQDNVGDSVFGEYNN